MGDGRFFRFAVIAVLALLAASWLNPMSRAFYCPTPRRDPSRRAVTSDAEQSIIALFEQVSPSVVQVVGRQGNRSMFDDEGAGAQSGTGFVWDGAVTSSPTTTWSAARRRTMISPSFVYALRIPFRGRSLSAVPPTSKSANLLSRSAIRSDST
jgi:hypothetical protein